jgi:hypothetical protein
MATATDKRIPSMQDLRDLARANDIVKDCHEAFLNSPGMSYQQMLQLTVVELAKRNAELQQQLLTHGAQSRRPFILSLIPGDVLKLDKIV